MFVPIYSHHTERQTPPETLPRRFASGNNTNCNYECRVDVGLCNLTCSTNANRRHHRVLVQHLPDARLEITILCGVDERIDAAV